MKTLTLGEIVLVGKINGELKFESVSSANDNLGFGIVNSTEGQFALIDPCGGDSVARNARAHLVAHSCNVLPGVVEALKNCLSIADDWNRLHHDRIATVQEAREILSKADIVEVS